ncbi:hypothetical protein FS837_002992 [Tulasnella sp. UAMH 9824]|nr:hypothetical protein FS837_002992 [Tulasnella sp. UAMH 9824]
MLTRALEYASEAVKMDRMDRSGYQVQGTIATYARCVSLLHELVLGGGLSDEERSRITIIGESYANRIRALAKAHNLQYPLRRGDGGQSTPVSPVSPGSIRFTRI